MFWLQRKGVPTTLAVVFIVILLVGLGMMAGTLIGSSVQDFSASVPVYEERLTGQVGSMLSWIEALDIDVPGIDLSRETIAKYLNAGATLRFLARSLTGARKVLTNAFFILLTAIFILLEASILPAKLRAAMSEPDRSLARLERIMDGVRRYLAVKTLTSLLTGALVAAWLKVLGVDYALLWGIVAFLFNYVPNIGSILAAIPGIIMALIQFGAERTIYVVLGYLVVNVAIGSVLEPRFLGRKLGLSALVVFLSLVFWGWVLGPVGMVLSVPLTMIVKVALESSDQTRWVAVLLGSDSSAPRASSPAGKAPIDESEKSKTEGSPAGKDKASAKSSAEPRVKEPSPGH
jgi:predicted PurR-regulated permease PerM